MSITTKALREAFESIKPVAKKTSLNITEYVRLRSKDGVLTLNSTDNATEIECLVEADLPEMDVCVQAQRLLAVVANAGAEIDLKLGKAGLAASSGAGRYRLPTAPGDSMPMIEHSEESTAQGFYKLVRDEVEFCHFAAAKNEASRPWANGVNIKRQAEMLSVAGCNGVSLFAHSFSDWTCEGGDFDIIVPTTATQLALSAWYTQFKVFPGVLGLYATGRTAKIKLLSATYPSMAPIISHERVGGFSVDGLAFLEALEAVAPFKSGAVPPCLIKVEPSTVSVIVESVNDRAEQSMPCESAAPGCEFHMNLDHMIGITRQCAGKVEFYWGRGFPTEPRCSPLLVKQGDRLMGSSLYRK